MVFTRPRLSHSKLDIYHLESREGEVAERPRVEDLVAGFELLDADGVVQDDGLGLLDVAERRHVKLHPAHVVGVAPHLDMDMWVWVYYM